LAGRELAKGTGIIKTAKLVGLGVGTVHRQFVSSARRANVGSPRRCAFCCTVLAPAAAGTSAGHDGLGANSCPAQTAQAPTSYAIQPAELSPGKTPGSAPRTTGTRTAATLT